MNTVRYFGAQRYTGMIILLMSLLFPDVKAQDSTRRNFIISVQGHYGYSMVHHDYMKHLMKEHIAGGELNYIFRTSGKKCWHPLYKYPEFGLSGVFMYLGNPSQLGNLVAVYPYTNLRLNKERRKFNLALRLGFGLAYISKPFDRLENHQNNTIGSYYNGFVNVRLNGSWMLNKAWRMDTGVGLMHASNGAMRTPNLGINMVTCSMGLGYVFGNKDFQMTCDSVMPKAKRRWYPSVIAVAGLKELEHPGGPKYMAYGLMFNCYRNTSYKNRFGAGIELAYNNATRPQLLDDSTVTSVGTMDILQAGGKIGYVYQLDRLSFPIEFGAYFYKSKANADLFFHRIGLRYLIKEHFIANLSLLTHWARADYFEFGFGYQF